MSGAETTVAAAAVRGADPPADVVATPGATALWFVFGTLIALFANGLAAATTSRTFGAMGGVSHFALAVYQHDLQVTTYYNVIAFPATTALVVAYVWPIVAHLRRGPGTAASSKVQRRVISLPLVIAAMGFAPWFLACGLLPLLTIHDFGHWSADLMSQQVLSPLVSGFLAATTTYLLLDWLVRARLVPLVFPRGRLTEVPGAWALGVRARLLVFLMAVAFTPLFTMLGLVRAAVVRVESGVPVATVVPVLAHAGTVTFVVYVALGILLTLVLARTLTRPVEDVAAALHRVQGGDLSARVRVTSSDEVGVLEDGVNAMVAALREKEHILQTFGRVVEPSVRDQLLSGHLRLGGELRNASVLFCDMRGFTTLAEHCPPDEVVTMLNGFFTAMTTWVRECGGFVDKFIGDSILVVFGLFDQDPGARHAATAIRCAVGMRERLIELNTARTAKGQPPLAITMGIHSGELLAGTIGALDRHEYTVIGDTVNVAARLQQLCKEQDRDLLVSQATYELARSSGFTGEVTLRDSVSLRGRSEPVRVFGVA
jgi:adenylate cyclase